MENMHLSFTHPHTIPQKLWFQYNHLFTVANECQPPKKNSTQLPIFLSLLKPLKTFIVHFHSLRSLAVCKKKKKAHAGLNHLDDE